ncbi:acylphosphatase [Candidatus Daviesbacteria bacterium]|nr:acylphosphatase [Candidatus Daviesbacteria bacterium]
MIKHLKIYVRGLVQGVFYRANASKKAEEFGIYGFAKNEADGSVYIEAEGEEKSLKEFTAWCKEGPELARVEELKIAEGDLKNFSEFKIQ